MDALIMWNPDQRFTAAQCLAHKYFVNERERHEAKERERAREKERERRERRDGPVFDQEEDESEDDMSDFIVPDEEGEAFTPADPTIPFVQETHELVHKYNEWEPNDKKGKKLKVFVDGLTEKYKTQDDERQFVNGTSVDYDHPPLKKQKSGK